MAMRVLPPAATCAASLRSRPQDVPTGAPYPPASAGGAGALPGASAFLTTSRKGDGSQYSVFPNLCLWNARQRNSLRFARVIPT